MPQQRSSGEDSRLGVIILGASTFPHYPADLRMNNPSFKRSADTFQKLFTNEGAYVGGGARVLDLFDSPGDPRQILARVKTFLSSPSLETIVIYYCGHGEFYGIRKDYCLVLRDSEYGNQGYTALDLSRAKSVVEDQLAGRSLFLILDCCYADKALDEWQGGIDHMVNERIFEAFPRRGTVLVTASTRDQPAIAPSGEPLTLFTGALTDTVRAGIANGRDALSFREVFEITRKRIREGSPTHPTPGIHAPSQPEGDISNWDFFVNRAYTGARPSKARPRARQAHTKPRSAEPVPFSLFRQPVRASIARSSPAVPKPEPKRGVRFAGVFGASLLVLAALAATVSVVDPRALPAFTAGVLDTLGIPTSESTWPAVGDAIRSAITGKRSELELEGKAPQYSAVEWSLERDIVWAHATFEEVGASLHLGFDTKNGLSPAGLFSLWITNSSDLSLRALTTIAAKDSATATSGAELVGQAEATSSDPLFSAYVFKLSSRPSHVRFNEGILVTRAWLEIRFRTNAGSAVWRIQRNAQALRMMSEQLAARTGLGIGSDGPDIAPAVPKEHIVEVTPAPAEAPAAEAPAAEAPAEPAPEAVPAEEAAAQAATQKAARELAGE